MKIALLCYQKLLKPGYELPITAAVAQKIASKHVGVIQNGLSIVQVKQIQMELSKMIAMALLGVTIKNNYALIMDANRNPLWRLPPAQRFQTMIYLAAMWTAIFCAAFGLWFWYGQLLAAHMLVILGSLVTSVTFAKEAGTSTVAAKIKKSASNGL